MLTHHPDSLGLGTHPSELPVIVLRAIHRLLARRLSLFCFSFSSFTRTIRVCRAGPRWFSVEHLGTLFSKCQYRLGFAALQQHLHTRLTFPARRHKLRSRVLDKHHGPVVSHFPKLFLICYHEDGAYANCSDRALGTALDWPDAKQHAGKVREWGIKVRLSLTIWMLSLCALVLGTCDVLLDFSREGRIFFF